jgi:hypothetical protein
LRLWRPPVPGLSLRKTIIQLQNEPNFCFIFNALQTATSRAEFIDENGGGQ